ncbi:MULTISPECIES: hypothetical protein [unclassified Streptomyces]|uniref:hypothetical protein n=1 Tax=unclassified Streptomyces TaxID=2593676 RepID=UPI002E807082|nr:hypothetical protein [Streptomyces sp. NBC_00569]WSE13297.1 hypothetical protein OG518_08245 [Streptomyces sp. NBC_01397]WUB97789.1 hypothetical protein OHO83_38740 [Streptomyces sp. NBC_00569]
MITSTDEQSRWATPTKRLTHRPPTRLAAPPSAPVRHTEARLSSAAPAAFGVHGPARGATP